VDAIDAASAIAVNRIGIKRMGLAVMSASVVIGLEAQRQT
jgi:hypothetical protein